MKTQNAMIANATDYMVVDDGQMRWAGKRALILGWLHERGQSPHFDASTRQDNSVSLGADEYNEMCRVVTCESDAVASAGSGECIELCDGLIDAGAGLLHVT